MGAERVDPIQSQMHQWLSAINKKISPTPAMYFFPIGKTHYKEKKTTTKKNEKIKNKEKKQTWRSEEVDGKHSSESRCPSPTCHMNMQEMSLCRPLHCSPTKLTEFILHGSKFKTQEALLFSGSI